MTRFTRRAAFIVATGVMGASTVLAPSVFALAFIGWIIIALFVMEEPS